MAANDPKPAPSQAVAETQEGKRARDSPLGMFDYVNEGNVLQRLHTM